MLRYIAVARPLALATLLPLAPGAYVQGRDESRWQQEKGKDALTGPLVLAKQGSFFVNEQDIATSFASGSGTPAPGHISVKGMYVQYQDP